MKRIMIDCDVGVDDAFALILAFRSPELEVKAITGVHGNVPLERVFINIQKVLSLIRPPQKPLIAKGAVRPLKREPLYAHSVHGRDGLGGARITQQDGERGWEVFPGPGDELIAETARRYPGEITLIAIGPLTNLALALSKDPEGMRKLKEIVVMGGAIRTGGNMTPHAEFNIVSDPLAARIVFESGIPVTLVPLDVTHQVFFTPEVVEERLRPMGNPFSRFIIEATGYDIKTRQFRGKELIYLHDPLAVGAVIEPGLLRKERVSLHVETDEGAEYGRTREVREGPEIEVCFEVASEKFLELFLSRLS